MDLDYTKYFLAEIFQFLSSLTKIKKIKDKIIMINQEIKVNINGINHWVKITGIENKRTPIVIIHGGPGGHHYAFEHTIGKRLENKYTVIYYEQRGSGRSDAPIDEKDYQFHTILSDLEELCIYLNLNKVILLGYSFGAEIALYYASKYPNRVEKVIAEAPSLITNIDYNAHIQFKGFKEVATKEEIEKLDKSQESNIHGADLMHFIWDVTSFDTHSKFLFHNQEKAQKMYDLWSKAWNEKKLSNTGKMADVIFHEHFEVDTLGVSKDIKCKTLIIIGKEDKNCGLKLAKSYEKAIPNSKLVVVPHAAHFVDFEQEDIFYQAVTEFIDKG